MTKEVQKYVPASVQGSKVVLNPETITRDSGYKDEPNLNLRALAKGLETLTPHFGREDDIYSSATVGLAYVLIPRNAEEGKFWFEQLKKGDYRNLGYSSYQLGRNYRLPVFKKNQDARGQVNEEKINLGVYHSEGEVDPTKSIQTKESGLFVVTYESAEKEDVPLALGLHSLARLSRPFMTKREILDNLDGNTYQELYPIFRSESTKWDESISYSDILRNINEHRKEGLFGTKPLTKEEDNDKLKEFENGLEEILREENSKEKSAIDVFKGLDFNAELLINFITAVKRVEADVPIAVAVYTDSPFMSKYGQFNTAGYVENRMKELLPLLSQYLFSGGATDTRLYRPDFVDDSSSNLNSLWGSKDHSFTTIGVIQGKEKGTLMRDTFSNLFRKVINTKTVPPELRITYKG